MRVNPHLARETRNKRLCLRAKKVALQRAGRLQQMLPRLAEYGHSPLLDWILALPWTKETEDKSIWPRRAHSKRTTLRPGQSEGSNCSKFLAVIKRRNRIKGPIFAWSDRLGVGKTSLGRRWLTPRRKLRGSPSAA